jgi:hypothetical protein
MRICLAVGKTSASLLLEYNKHKNKHELFLILVPGEACYWMSATLSATVAMYSIMFSIEPIFAVYFRSI